MAIKIWPPTGILSVALSPDGKRLAVGSNDRTAHIVPADGSNAPEHRASGHTDTVQYVDFSPNGQWVLTASDDGTVRISERGRSRSAGHVPHRAVEDRLRRVQSGWHPDCDAHANRPSGRCACMARPARCVAGIPARIDDRVSRARRQEPGAS